MKTLFLKMVLKSDAAFGRGDGIAGIIDNEVQHDELGCPYLNGKEIKGILVQECAGILAGLPAEKKSRWETAAQRLFGRAGSLEEDEARLVIGDARLPDDLRRALKNDLESEVANIQKDQYDPDYENRKRIVMNRFRARVLDSLTGFRQQTAINPLTGVARQHSLRTTRVILRETPFAAQLEYRSSGKSTSEKDEQDDLALLAACAAAFRRAGAGRNRGLGQLEAELLDAEKQSVQQDNLKNFIQEVKR